MIGDVVARVRRVAIRLLVCATSVAACAASFTPRSQCFGRIGYVADGSGQHLACPIVEPRRFVELAINRRAERGDRHVEVRHRPIGRGQQFLEHSSRRLQRFARAAERLWNSDHVGLKGRQGSLELRGRGGE